MTHEYEYIKLIGLLAFLAGILKLIIGFWGHSFGVHYLSSFIILGIGIVLFFVGLIIQKLSEIKEE